MRGLRVCALSLAAAVAALLGIAGCNPGPSPEFFATAALPATIPFTASTAVAVPATAGALQITMPSGGAFSGEATLSVTNVVTGTRLVQTLSNVAPVNVPALAQTRKVSSENLRRPLAANGVVAILYLCYMTNDDIVLSGNPSFSFTLPDGYDIAGVDYYMALFAGSQWGMGYAGPGTFAGSVLNFTGAFPFTITANTNVCFALYAQPTTLPPATLPPRPTPVPCPSGMTTCGSTAVTIP
jgi:hypothetical protein